MLRLSSLLLAITFLSNVNSQISDSSSCYKPSLGFNFGLNQSILYNSNETDNLQIQNALGFRLGITADFSFSKNWSFAPKSELSFNYCSVTENNITKKVDPYNLNFMTHIKYRFKNYSGKAFPYCYIGPNLRVPLNDKFKGSTYDTKTALAIDFAFGVDIELKNYLFSPELRFSGGVTDIRRDPTGKMLRGSNAALVLNFTSK